MRARAYVYILRCADGTLYTGYTTDLDRRLREHSRGSGSKYTRIRTPVELVFSQACQSRRQAMSREAMIKTWPRRKKIALIDNPTARKSKPTKNQ